MKRKAFLFSVFAVGTILLSAPSSAYLETRSKLLEYQPITLDVNDTLLVLSIIAFSMALVCYTTGVFSEMIAKELKPWHVKIFWLGFLFEICGAIPMFLRSEKRNISLHKIVGAIGLALIITHNVLASIAIRTNLDIVLKMFPKFSAFVYAIWLIAFVTGMIIGMKKSKSILKFPKRNCNRKRIKYQHAKWTAVHSQAPLDVVPSAWHVCEAFAAMRTVSNRLDFKEPFDSVIGRIIYRPEYDDCLKRPS